MDSVDAGAAGVVCPKCGSPQASLTDCTACGINFEKYRLAKEKIRLLESQLRRPASVQTQTAATTAATANTAQPAKCPACGHVLRQPQAASCEACGIYFEKYRARQSATRAAAPSSEPRPAPVKPVEPPVAGRPGKAAMAIAIGLVLLNIFLTLATTPPGAPAPAVFGGIVGAVFVWPLIIIGIAAIWKRNRNRSRVLLVFNIASVVVVMSLLMQIGDRAGAVAVAVAPKTTGSLSDAQLQRLKRSVAYVTVKASWSEHSGTGFLAHRDGDTGLVVTNAHVIRADRREASPAIHVVFSSGASNAVDATAEIAAIDEAADLALLRVTSRNLPDAIALSNTALFAETQDVLILGFPFGSALATAGTTPAITIGKGVVSSNRFNENGQIGYVQIDGDINPGNSGGPIVTTAGELVGVSTAAVLTTNIGFAVPVRQIRNLIAGRLTNLQALKFGDTITLRGHIADAFGNVREARLNVVETDEAAIRAALRADGDWDKVKGSIREATFEEKEKGMEASLSLPEYISQPYLAKHYIGQVALGMADGSTLYQPPFRIMARSDWGMLIAGEGVAQSDAERYQQWARAERKGN